MQLKIIKHKNLRASQAHIGWEGRSNGDLWGIMLGGEQSHALPMIARTATMVDLTPAFRSAMLARVRPAEGLGAGFCIL